MAVTGTAEFDSDTGGRLPSGPRRRPGNYEMLTRFVVDHVPSILLAR